MKGKKNQKGSSKNSTQGPRFSDLTNINYRIDNETPARGDYFYEYKLKQALLERNNYEADEFRSKFKIEFEDLPISNLSQRALHQRKFRKMTEIQRCVIPHALAGRDIIGASKTGSGKTLCYLIPMIECLYRHKTTPLDGLSGLILLPTRELAMQVFEVYNSITQGHILSVGLLIGGKNISFEKQMIQNMNILICTPGRLLQHLEETPGFETYNLRMLIIDEADTLFELGFKEALQAILSNIPKDRQTMLFSATLTKDIHHLSHVSMQQPEMIILNQQKSEESGIYDTPATLKQTYMITNSDEKIDVLFSFLKSHIHDKILVFFASCKEVRFVYEAFRKLRIGTPIFELHGRQKQAKRMAMYFTFAEKRFATLLTTNVASRGLDFPKIDWVVQFDCPEDIPTYVHRVGRTARYKAGGNSLLMLLKSEEKMVQKIQAKGIKINQIHLNPKKQLTIKNTVQSFVSESVDLKYLAQRAFISYMRSVYLAADKEVFDVMQINHNDLAESLGLVQTPVITFKKIEKQQNDSSDEECDPQPKKKSKLLKLRDKIDSKKQQKQKRLEAELGQELINDGQEETNKLTDLKHMKTITRTKDISHIEKIRADIQYESKGDLEGGLFKKKGLLEPIMEKTQLIISKNQLKKIKTEGHFNGRNKIYFDEEGNNQTYEEKRRQNILQEQKEIVNRDADLTGELFSKLHENAELDRRNELERRKAKRIKRKAVIEEVEEQSYEEDQELEE